MKNKLKPTIHIFIGGFLIVIFILILFFSTSSNVSEEVIIDSEIKMVITGDLYKEIKIGEVYFKNENFLPAKYKLQEYVLCDFTENQPTRTYPVEYRGAVSKSYPQDIFSGGSYFYDYIELSSREELKLSLVANMYRFDGRMFNESKTLYLFVSDDSYDRYYDYCTNLEQSNAMKEINVEITQAQAK